MGIWKNLYGVEDIVMIRFKPSLKTMMRLNGETLWIGQLSLTTGRTCLESNGFMLGKIAGAFNSHDNQNSKIKQPKYEVIRLVVVELNSLYLLDSHHSEHTITGIYSSYTEIRGSPSVATSGNNFFFFLL